MNRRMANEQCAAELLQARDAVRVVANPSHIGFDLSLGRATRLDACSTNASWNVDFSRSAGKSGSPIGRCGSNTR